jgi:hypothetical protein
VVMAQLRGKISSDDWVGVEDQLTGMVLGALKNLHPSLAADVFRRAQAIKGENSPQLHGELRWTFWPAWESCEPDVVVEDATTLCVVEAKLYADFGKGIPETRQLAREWRDGSDRADRAGKAFWLIALTNHGSQPTRAIAHQLEHGHADLSHVAWLSWSDVGRAIRQAPDEHVRRWREDLMDVLGRVGLAPFEGFRSGREAGDELSMVLPWMSSANFRMERLPEPGFATLLASVAAQDTSTGVWHLALRQRRPDKGRMAALGFGAAVDTAVETAVGGMPEWRLKLSR